MPRATSSRTSIWYGQTVAAFARNQRHLTAPRTSSRFNARSIRLRRTGSSTGTRSDTREQRYDARNASLTNAYDELREIVGLAQQSTLSLKRAVETLQTAGPAAGQPAAAREATSPAAAAPSSTAPDPNAFKYVAFEDRFRGSTDDIRARLLDYLPLFDGATNVLDVGCGRGELLELLRERRSTREAST